MKKKFFRRAMLDLIAPHDLTCAVCGSGQGMMQGTGLCSKCLFDMEGTVFVKRIYREVLAYAPLIHRGAAADLVYGLKYGAKGHHAYVLGHFMQEAIREHVQDDVIIVPVPQHMTGYLKRGFNPVQFLAEELAERLEKDMVHALRKIRRTKHQAALSGLERQANVKGAFALRDRLLVRGKHILLVDDVLTTGATCRECTMSLLAAGAKSVTCITATYSASNADR